LELFKENGDEQTTILEIINKIKEKTLNLTR
jgi:hypothetical protein